MEYRYMHSIISEDDLERYLNEYGQGGWRVVHMDRLDDDYAVTLEKLID